MNSGWEAAAVSAEQVVARLGSRNNVFVHGAAATPTTLLDAMVRRGDLEGVRLYHLHLEGRLSFLEPRYDGRFRSVSLFTGPACRAPIAEGRADYVPIFLSDIPSLFTSRDVPLDAALVQLSPPDAHGFCTLGPSVDAARAAVDSAAIVLAEINHQMPRTHGNALVPLSRLTAYTITDRPLHEHGNGKGDAVTALIGEHVAALVNDGATLQMGIGAIPDAVLSRLFDKHDLGVHTEMFSDRLVDLVEAGVITNRHKPTQTGRISTSFVNGTRRLFDFIDDNPLVHFHGCDWTNDTQLIARMPGMTAINSAIQVDLTGQVNADSMGHRIYSGIGGQMDFIRGAARARNGKAIIALPSTAARGTISRIATELNPGAGVVTTRGHVHWVVTEYGAVNLHGRSIRERGELLISIAHPDFQAELGQALRGRVVG